MNANYMNPYKNFETYFQNVPTEDGRYGEYGGAYLPPQLIPAFEEITAAYNTICNSFFVAVV